MKRLLYTICLILIASVLRGQEIDFTGVYIHEFEDERSYLEVIQNEGQISGELHDYRGVYFLHGSLEENRGKGLINLGDDAHFFEMDMLGDHLHLYIINMTEYGEPDYATQYDLLFIEDSTAEKPTKTIVNPFGLGNDKSDANYISSGKISAPYLGVQFNVPKGFKAENNKSDIVLLANSGFGYIFVFRHDFDSKTDLKAFLSKGYSDEEMNLMVSGIEDESDSVISFDAKGYLQGNKVKVKGMSNLGPHGHGVILFYVMKEDEYLSVAKQELELIESTMTFFPITVHPLSQRWTYDLQGKSLKYGKSSSSGVVSSAVLKTTAWINLCPDMTFKMVEPGKDDKKKVLEGKWNVEVHYGVAHLNLFADNNEKQTYQLSHENGRLLMNKERWIVLKGFESECSTIEQN